MPRRTSYARGRSPVHSPCIFYNSIERLTEYFRNNVCAQRTTKENAERMVNEQSRAFEFWQGIVLIVLFFLYKLIMVPPHIYLPRTHLPPFLAFTLPNFQQMTT